MSRSLGHRARHKKAEAAGKTNSPQNEGARAFKAAIPREANPYGFRDRRGKGHAWDRGWRRAQQESQR